MASAKDPMNQVRDELERHVVDPISHVPVSCSRSMFPAIVSSTASPMRSTN